MKHVVLPPETSVWVPINAVFGSKSKDLFVECHIAQDSNQRQFYGSPDSLISLDNPFLHVSNFSDAPVVISKGQFIGHAHNPRNWLDRQQGSSKDTQSKELRAYLVRNLIKAQITDTEISG